MDSSVEASQSSPSPNPKPSLGSKPRLTPRPFSMQKSATFRSINAPKTSQATSESKTSTDTLNATGGYRSALTTPAQPTAISASKPRPLSLPTENHLKLTKASEVVLPMEDSPDSGVSDPAPKTTPPKETPSSEPVQKNIVIQTDHERSTKTLSNSEQKNEIKTEDETPVFVPQTPEEPNSDSPSAVSSPFRWGGTRKRLSMELTAKFESGGVPLPPQPVKTTTKPDKRFSVTEESSEPEQNQAAPKPLTPESDAGEQEEDYKRGKSIKDRISCLFDSVGKQEGTWMREEPETIDCGVPLSPQPVKTTTKPDTQRVSVTEEPSEPEQNQAAPKPLSPESKAGEQEENYNRRKSIKDRISCLFDSVGKQEGTWMREDPTTIDGIGDVNKQIKNWAAGTSSESPDIEQKPQLAPRVCSKSFEFAAVSPSEKTPEKLTMEVPAAEESQKEPPKQAPGEDKSLEISTKTSEENNKTTEGVKLRRQPTSDTSADNMSRRSIKRRSVRFGIVETDDGSPPVVLGSDPESSTEEEEADDENERGVDDSISELGLKTGNKAKQKNQETEKKEKDDKEARLWFEELRNSIESMKREVAKPCEEEEESEGKLLVKNKGEKEEAVLQQKEIEKERNNEKEKEEKLKQDEECRERERLKEEEIKERERQRQKEEQEKLNKELELRRQKKEEEKRLKQEEQEKERLKEEAKERKRLEEEERVKEKLRQEEEKRLRENQRQEEEQRLREKQRQEEEERLREKQRQEEEERLREKQRQEEEERLREKQRQEEEQRLREKQRQEEEERLREKQRQEEEERLREKQRQEEEQRLREKQRQEEERMREKQRQEEEEILREKQRQEEEERLREKQRQEEEEILREKQRQEEEERLREKQRQEEEERLREKQRQEEERLREKQRQEEEERLREKQRQEEEMMREKQRQEEEERLREKQRQEEERLMEKQRKEEEERLREKQRQEEEMMREKQRQEEEERLREKQRQEEEMMREKRRQEEEERLREKQRQEEERLREKQRQEEEDRKRHELERKREEERQEEKSLLEKESADGLEGKKQEDLEKLQADKYSETDEEEKSKEPGLMMNFDSRHWFHKKESENSPSLKTDEHTETLIDVVYDDFSIRKPSADVEYDDFSVKPRKWASQTKAEPVSISWTFDKEDLLMSFNNQPQESQKIEKQVEHESEVSSIQENPAEEETELLVNLEMEEKECPEDDVEVEEEEGAEEGNWEEEEMKEDEAEEEDNEAQINSYFTNDEDKQADDEYKTYKATSDTDSPKSLSEQLHDFDCVDSHKEPDFVQFPEMSTPLLDTSTQRSKVELSRKRNRTRPSRSFRVDSEKMGKLDWRVHDTTDKRETFVTEKELDSEKEEEELPKPKAVISAPSIIPKVPMFPGLSPAALLAGIKKRTGGEGFAAEEEIEKNKETQEKESQNEEEERFPSQLSQSPRLPSHLAGAARVLPPMGSKDGGAISSPAWLKELKSKKRMSQHGGKI